MPGGTTRASQSSFGASGSAASAGEAAQTSAAARTRIQPVSRFAGMDRR
jgi:hypothetical protein